MATTRTGKELAKRAEFVDDRLNASSNIRHQLNKVFPDHWSFMLGEVALYSFIILLLTGTYLTLFFDASTAPVIYHGSYLPLRGVTMTEAYASTLNISFDVRAGLLIRQVHHWAALLFVAAIVAHLCRVFFTGAFRKPRELNWTIGVLLLILAIVEGFAGYSLPADLLSGEGLRIAYSIVLSLPVVGTWAAFLLFGGPYPGTSIEGRLYVAHILLIPGILLALIAAHLAILWHQKHTQFAGPGRTEKNVVGERFFPYYTAKAGGFFFIVFGILAALGGLAQINPIWLYGPYNAYNASAGSQPDWYMGFLDGAVRLMPNLEFRGLGYDIPFNILIPAVILPGILFNLLFAVPLLEAKLSGDHDYHHIAQKPRESPTRTGLGVMALTFYVVLVAASATDIFASIFRISLNTMLWSLRVALIVLPPIGYKVAKTICINLRDNDKAERDHGFETGVIRQLPTGQFREIHHPLPEPEQPHLTPVGGHHDDLALPGPDEAEAPASLIPAAYPAVAVADEPASTNGSNGHKPRRFTPSGRGLVAFFFKPHDSE